MNKINTFQIYLLLWLFPFLGNAQAGYPEEQLLLHTDRELYISGETVWFKVYALEQDETSLSNFSKVAYLELINQKGLSLSRVKLELVDGLGIGTIELPNILKSGPYILRSYTQAMRNLEYPNFGDKKLIILHPTQALVQASEKDTTIVQPFLEKKNTAEKSATQQLSVGVQSNKEQYGQRELVTLEITTKDELEQPVAAQLSLSVALANPSNLNKRSIYQSVPQKKTSKNSTKSNPFLFSSETHGLSLSGKVINTSTDEALPNAEVYLAFAGKTAMVYTAISDKAGNFNFLLPKLFGVQQVVLQALSKETDKLKIVIEEKFHEVTIDTTSVFQLSPEWIDYANQLMVNAQIEQSYQAFAPHSIYRTQSTFPDLPFYGAPDKDYLLDDYNRFPLPEFFFEIVSEVRVKGKFGEEQLEIINGRASGLSKLGPLLLVDGIPVFNQRTFLKINNKLIKSAQIIKDPFWLNPSVYNGIIQLSSFEGDARSFTLPETAIRQSYLTFLPQKQFPESDYSKTPDNHLPDFRNTLYWNPTIQTNSNGKASIQFFSSDALGEYTIHLVGTANRKLLGSGTATIQVVKNKISE